MAPPSPEELATSPTSSVAENDTLFAPPPKEALGDADYQEVQKTINRPFLDARIIGTEVTSDKELDAIAKHHSISPEELRKYASFFGARREQEEVGAAALGGISRAVGLGIPQFVVKKMETDENFRKALDDVRELADTKRSLLEAGAEALLPGGAIARLGKGVRGLVTGGAATGSIYGTTASREGEELSGAAVGAGLGSVLGGTVAGVKGYLQNRGTKAAKLIEDQASRFAEDNQSTIMPAVDKAYNKIQPSDEAINALAVRGTDEQIRLVTDDAARKLIDDVLPTESLAEFRSKDTTKGQAIADRAEKTGQSVDQVLLSDVIENRAQDIAEALTEKRGKTLDDARKLIQQNSGQGLEYIEKEIAQQLTKRRLAMEVIREGGYVSRNSSPEFFRRAADFMSDAQFVFRTYDEKYGTDTGKILRDAGKAGDAATYARAASQKDIGNIASLARKNKLSENNLREIFTATEAGQQDSLPSALRTVAKEISALFEKGRVEARTIAAGEKLPGLDIAERPNYMPSMVVEPANLILTLERRAADMYKRYGVDSLKALSPEEFSKARLEDGEFNDLIRAMELYDSREISTPLQATTKLLEALNPRMGTPKMELLASRAMERKDAVPDFIREKNPLKLLDKWYNSTYRTVFLRPFVERMKTQKNILTRLGDDVAAKYVENWIQDVTGVRSETAARAFTSLRNQYILGVERLADRIGGERGELVRTAKYLPDVMTYLNRLIYSNNLGLSPRSTIQNMTQTWLKTAPELGGVYGYTAVLQGFMRMAKEMASGGTNSPKSLLKRVETMGLAPAEFIPGSKQALAEGLAASWPVRSTVGLVDKAADWSMKIYQKTDSLNRAVTLSVAEKWAQDIAARKPAALAALAKADTSIQRELLQPGVDTTEVLAKYLIDKTQYRYNRLAMSEYGRTMGPIFSAFTKWPLATAGDILSDVRVSGLLKSSPRIAEKYLLPWALISGAGYLVHGNMEEGGILTSDQKKKLFGAKGLGASAPVSAVPNIVTGDFFSAPAIDLLWNDVVVPAWKQDTLRTEAGIARAIQNFGPGMVYVRFLTDDIATLLTGEKPEGNFIERTARGAEKLTK